MRCLKLVFSIVAVGAILVATAGPVLAQAVWNCETEFSIDRNPSGPWTYGCVNQEGQFVPYNDTFDLGDGIVGWCMGDDPDSCGNVTVNTSSNPVEKFGIVWEPGQILAHPGLFGCKAVIRWTSPVSGTLGVGIGLSLQSRHGAPAGIEISHQAQSVAQRVADGFAGVGQTKEGRSGSVPDLGLNPVVTMNRGETFDIAVSDTGVGVTGHVAVNITVAASGQGASTSEEQPKPVAWDYSPSESLVAFLAARDNGLASIGALSGLRPQATSLVSTRERG